MPLLAKIAALLDGLSIKYRIIEHTAEGNTVLASKIRDHPLCEAAKSLVLRASYARKADRRYIMAVIPGDRMLDVPTLTNLLDAKKLGFVNPVELINLTGCTSGSVPPLCFHTNLELIADNMLANSAKIVFNAGRLDVSIELSTDDYLNKVVSTVQRISV